MKPPPRYLRFSSLVVYLACAAPPSLLLATSVFGCASSSTDPNASSPSADSGAEDTSTTSPTTADGAGSGASEAAVDARSSPTTAPDAGGTGACKPTSGAAALPFVVDSVYVASGYMGDAPTAGADGGTTVSMLPAKTGDDATCGGNRSSAGALGSCHTILYTPLAAGSGNQWAGVFWQFPANNWGAMGGYAIPPGATKISFWARGQSGGERVLFGAGYTGIPTAATPCTDTVMVAASQALALTTAWQHVTINLAGETYPNGVLGAFDWTIQNPTGSDGGGPPAPIVFYVDDIEWQP